jgi:hypothetical protein
LDGIEIIDLIAEQDSLGNDELLTMLSLCPGALRLVCRGLSLRFWGFLLVRAAYSNRPRHGKATDDVVPFA